MGQTNTQNFTENSEFHTSIGIILSNDSNLPSIGSQIIHDEFSVSSGSNIYSCCTMDVVSETVQPMVPQLVIHGLPTINTLNKNNGIFIPAISAIGRTMNTTHGSATGNDVGQGTLVG